jgi:hypothetical protein
LLVVAGNTVMLRAGSWQAAQAVESGLQESVMTDAAGTEGLGRTAVFYDARVTTGQHLFSCSCSSPLVCFAVDATAMGSWLPAVPGMFVWHPLCLREREGAESRDSSCQAKQAAVAILQNCSLTVFALLRCCLLCKALQSRKQPRAGTHNHMLLLR